MTELPFVDRAPTPGELERIRLILSTYQDGTGMLATRDGKTLPGWRDLERSVAAALLGTASESKAVFDVVLSAPDAERRPSYGLSCKMRRELNRIARDGRVTIEVSNAASQFWSALDKRGIRTKDDLSTNALEAGATLMDVVHGWHQAIGTDTGGTLDLEKSSYLVLLWNTHLDYQFFQHPLRLFDAAKVEWSIRSSTKKLAKESRTLCGYDRAGRIVEWYGFSGGQLKLYPLASEALWRSERFNLEPLPEDTGMWANKAEAYFPEKWQQANA